MPTAFSGLIHPWHPLLLLISTLNTYIHVSPPSQIHKQQSWKNCCAVKLVVPTTGEMSYMLISIPSQPDVPAFTFGTCGNQISVSTLITDKDSFMLGLASVMPGRQFTMPWTYTVRLTPVLYILHPISFLLLNHTANVLIHVASGLPGSVTFRGLKILIHAANVLSVTFRGLNVLIHAANVLSGSVTFRGLEVHFFFYNTTSF